MALIWQDIEAMPGFSELDPGERDSIKRTFYQRNIVPSTAFKALSEQDPEQARKFMEFFLTPTKRSDAEAAAEQAARQDAIDSSGSVPPEMVGNLMKLRQKEHDFEDIKAAYGIGSPEHLDAIDEAQRIFKRPIGLGENPYATADPGYRGSGEGALTGGTRPMPILTKIMSEAATIGTTAPKEPEYRVGTDVYKAEHPFRTMGLELAPSMIPVGTIAKGVEVSGGLLIPELLPKLVAAEKAAKATKFAPLVNIAEKAGEGGTAGIIYTEIQKQGQATPKELRDAATQWASLTALPTAVGELSKIKQALVDMGVPKTTADTAVGTMSQEQTKRIWPEIRNAQDGARAKIIAGITERNNTLINDGFGELDAIRNKYPDFAHPTDETILGLTADDVAGLRASITPPVSTPTGTVGFGLVGEPYTPSPYPSQKALPPKPPFDYSSLEGQQLTGTELTTGKPDIEIPKAEYERWYPRWPGEWQGEPDMRRLIPRMSTDDVLREAGVFVRGDGSIPSQQELDFYGASKTPNDVSTKSPQDIRAWWGDAPVLDTGPVKKPGVSVASEDIRGKITSLLKDNPEGLIVDQMVAKSSLSVGEVSSALTMMELNNQVIRKPGGVFHLSESEMTKTQPEIPKPEVNPQTTQTTQTPPVPVGAASTPTAKTPVAAAGSAGRRFLTADGKVDGKGLQYAAYRASLDNSPLPVVPQEEGGLGKVFDLSRQAWAEKASYTTESGLQITRNDIINRITRHAWTVDKEATLDKVIGDLLSPNKEDVIYGRAQLQGILGLGKGLGGPKAPPLTPEFTAYDSLRIQDALRDKPGSINDAIYKVLTSITEGQSFRELEASGRLAEYFRKPSPGRPIEAVKPLGDKTKELLSIYRNRIENGQPVDRATLEREGLIDATGRLSEKGFVDLNAGLVLPWRRATDKQKTLAAALALDLGLDKALVEQLKVAVSEEGDLGEMSKEGINKYLAHLRSLQGMNNVYSNVLSPEQVKNVLNYTITQALKTGQFPWGWNPNIPIEMIDVPTLAPFRPTQATLFRTPEGAWAKTQYAEMEAIGASSTQATKKKLGDIWKGLDFKQRRTEAALLSDLSPGEVSMRIRDARMAGKPIADATPELQQKAQEIRTIIGDLDSKGISVGALESPDGKHKHIIDLPDQLGRNLTAQDFQWYMRRASMVDDWMTVSADELNKPPQVFNTNPSKILNQWIEKSIWKNTKAEYGFAGAFDPRTGELQASKISQVRAALWDKVNRGEVGSEYLNFFDDWLTTIEEPHFVKTRLAQAMLDLTYLSKIILNVSMGAVNATQAIIGGLAFTDLDIVVRAMVEGFMPKYWKMAAEKGILSEAFAGTIETEPTSRGLLGAMGLTGSRTSQVARRLSWTMSYPEGYDRVSAMRQAMLTLKRYGNTQGTAKKLLGVDLMPDTSGVWDANGKILPDREWSVIRAYNNKLNFGYNPGETPMMFQTELGRLLWALGSYPVRQLELVIRMNPAQRLRYFAALWTFGGLGAIGIGNYALNVPVRMLERKMPEIKYKYGKLLTLAKEGPASMALGVSLGQRLGMGNILNVFEGGPIQGPIMEVLNYTDTAARGGDGSPGSRVGKTLWQMTPGGVASWRIMRMIPELTSGKEAEDYRFIAGFSPLVAATNPEGRQRFRREVSVIDAIIRGIGFTPLNDVAETNAVIDLRNAEAQFKHERERSAGEFLDAKAAGDSKQARKIIQSISQRYIDFPRPDGLYQKKLFQSPQDWMAEVERERKAREKSRLRREVEKGGKGVIPKSVYSRP